MIVGLISLMESVALVEENDEMEHVANIRKDYSSSYNCNILFNDFNLFNT